ncbi:MAG: hypothetical protein JSR40_02720 [Proteobacteria bacterium]|nr:hypothetical protein [Pseudomonadota bacterium]
MSSGTRELRQNQFRSTFFANGDVSERLHDQWAQTYALDAARSSDDAEHLFAEAKRVDLNLIRGAVTHLQRALGEAATHDAATLLRERVLDTSVEQPSVTRWFDWLSQAECWPKLAIAHWGDVQTEAEDQVVAALEAEGVVLNDEAKKEIYLAVRGMTLADIIPPEMYERFFPPTAEGSEGSDGGEF